MTSSSYNIFSRGVLISGLAVLGAGLINYFARRFLALGLPVNEFAFFYGAFAVVTLFGTCLDVGSGSALNILLPKFQVRKKTELMQAYFSTAFGLRLALGCFSAILLMLIGRWLSEQVFHFPRGTPLLLWTLAVLPFYSVFCFIIDICSALQEFTFRSWLWGGQTFLVLIGILVLLPFCGSIAPPVSFICSYVIAIPAGLVVLAVKYPFLRPIPSLSIPLLLHIWRLSRWFFIVSIGTALLTNLDSIILAAISSLHSLALYNVAIPVTHIFQGLLVVPAVFMPVAAALWHNDDKNALASLYSDAQAFLLMICGACVVVTIVNGEWLLGFLFKKEYKEAAPALALLTSGLFFNCMAQMNISLLATIEKPGKIAAAVGAGAAVGVGGFYIGGLLFNAAGVAAARSLGMAVMFAVSQYYLSKRSMLKFSWKYGILTVVAVVVLWVAAAYFKTHEGPGVISALYLATYGLLVSPLLPSVGRLVGALSGSSKQPVT